MRPKADYRLLEDPDTLAQVKEDPRGFLDDLRLDVPGFSGAGEGVQACGADSIAAKVLGFRT